MHPRKQTTKRSRPRTVESINGLAAGSSTSAAVDPTQHQTHSDDYELKFPDIEMQPNNDLNLFELGLLERLSQEVSADPEIRETPAQTFDHLDPSFGDAYHLPGQILQEDEQGATVFYRRKT